MLRRIRKWITDRALMWAARRIAARLREQVPQELDALWLRAQMSPGRADDAGVRILQGTLDPVLRTEATSIALCALGDELERRAAAREGHLDDALVVVFRGALNC